MIVQEVQRFPAQMPASTDRSGSGGAGGGAGPGANKPRTDGQAGNSTSKQNSTRKRPMWPLYAIVAMSLAPVVAAVLAYFAPELGLRPEGHTNYGQLVQPQREMPSAEALPLTDLEGRPFDLNQLRGQWVLVTADTAACPESCVRKLFILRNSHASQGKNVDRLSRVWFVTDDKQVPQAVLDAYVGTHMLRANPADLNNFLAPGQQGTSALEAMHGHMWIIDPLGNLMMEFPPNSDPIEVRDDIIKLLKNSRIG